jgi:MFS family permease
MENTKSISSKWLALLTVSIGTYMSTLDASIINITFPRLTKVFEIEPSVVLWVSVAYLLVSTSLMLTMGKIGDVFGRKRIYILGFILFTIGLTFCSFSQNIVQLILARAVQGIGAAMLMAVGAAIVTAAFPDCSWRLVAGFTGLESCLLHQNTDRYHWFGYGQDIS